MICKNNLLIAAQKRSNNIIDESKNYKIKLTNRQNYMHYENCSLKTT